MKIAVLGTGTVGQTLASALIECEHTVCLGSRTPDNDIANQWAVRTGGSCAQYGPAASGAELVINATAGIASVSVFEGIKEHLSGKIILDVANALDFSAGFPPTLAVCNTTSLAEQLQDVVPTASVVKTLNTVNAEIMVAPQLLGTDHALFISGNDESAKQVVGQILRELGWRDSQVIDLGDIKGARAMEMYLPLWVRMYQTFGSSEFNISITRPSS